MIEFFTVFGSMIFFLVMQAFFSGSEMAMVSIEKNYLRHQAALGSRGARYALSMLSRPDWMLSTTLVGTNIATVANTTIVTAYLIELLGDKGGILALFILVPTIWLFAEIIPKSVFQQKSHQLVPVVIYGLWFFSFILSPIVFVFSLISRLINRGDDPHSSPFIQREELISMVQTPDVIKGDIKEIEKDMIQRVFNFSETTAEQAMTALDKVDAFSHNSTVREALQL
jgi:CBS domain containing-hemolysin-like protein